MKNPLNCPIILASTSPRRIELMKQVGIDVLVQKPDCDETPRRGETPRGLVSRLARTKAESVFPQALAKHGTAMIIAADTTVVAPDGRTVLNKPVDEKDARRMLRKLAGHTHQVLTGYCVLAGSREKKDTVRVVRVVSSRVRMRAMTPAMIEAYVKTGEPMDKAGSYAAQGIGMGLIESLNGSYTNVVGLPMAQLLRDLETKFGVSAFTAER